MHTLSPGRRLSLTTLVVSIVAATAIYASGSSIAVGKSKHHHHHHHKHKTKGPLAGTWSGSYAGAYSGTFTLKWKQTGSKLSGTIKLSSPKGSFTCNGAVHGGSITFGVVSAGATYTGSVSGKSMSGTYHTKKGGGSWSAHKTS